MENITIYTDAEGRVYLSQDMDSTLTAHEVEQLPPIPPRETDNNLYDGYHIYLDGVFTFGYELNANKCYGAINDFKAKLKATDYIARQKAEGKDVSKHNDVLGEVDNWRNEINRIQELIETNPIV